MNDVKKFQPKTLLSLSLIQTCINVPFNWVCTESEKCLPDNLRRLVFYNWEDLLDTYLTTTPHWMHAIENNQITFDSEEPLTIQTIMFLKHWNANDYSYCPFLPERCLFVFSYVHLQTKDIENEGRELDFLEEKLCRHCFYKSLVEKVVGRFVCSMRTITLALDKLLILRSRHNYCRLCKTTPLFSIFDVSDENMDFYTDVPTQRRRSQGDEYGLLDGGLNPLNLYRKNPTSWHCLKARQYMSRPRFSSSDSE